MTDSFEAEKSKASAWFRTLRDDIVAAFEGLEDSDAGDGAPGRFEVTDTKRHADDGSDAGGGLMSVMRGGRVFEKVGVNVSTVYGQLGRMMIRDFGRLAFRWSPICKTRTRLRCI